MTSISIEMVDVNNLHKKIEEPSNTEEFSAPILNNGKVNNNIFLVEVKEEHKDLISAALTENKITDSSVMKTEPEWDQFETKQFSKTTFMCEQAKLKPELITEMESELFVKNEKYFLDIPSQISDTDGSKDVSPKQIEVPVKIEPNKSINEIEYKPEFVLVDWNNKGEVIVKEEEIKQNHIIVSPSCSNQKEYRKHKCIACDYQTKWKSDLKRHLLQHQDPNDVNAFKCEECDFVTLYRSSLKNHCLRQHPEIGDFLKCNQCDYQTRTKGDLLSHLAGHKDDTFKCDQCDFKSIYKCSLTKHLKRHGNRDDRVLFKCDQCDYQTRRKDVLKTHLLRHKNIEEVCTYRCYQCDYKSIEKGSLKKHLQRHKNLEELNFFKCDQCDFKTIDKFYLRRHYLRHKNQKNV